MKKLLIGFFLLTLFLFVGTMSASAQWGMMGGYGNTNTNDNSAPSSQTEQQYQKELQDLVSKLLVSQHVGSVRSLNCSKITNDEFEKIGDGWMSVWIGNEAMHEHMDNVLGGEGSDNLTHVHIQMGKDYLSCSNTTNTDTWGYMPMMLGNTTLGGGVFSMMGWNGNGFGMGWNGTFGLVGILATIGWIVVLIDLILVGIWLWQQIRTPKRK